MERNGEKAETGPSKEPALRVFNVAELMGAFREILLLHAGEFYTLRITSKGKLILTK